MHDCFHDAGRQRVREPPQTRYPQQACSLHQPSTDAEHTRCHAHPISGVPSYPVHQHNGRDAKAKTARHYWVRSPPEPAGCLGERKKPSSPGGPGPASSSISRSCAHIPPASNQPNRLPSHPRLKVQLATTPTATRTELRTEFTHTHTRAHTPNTQTGSSSREACTSRLRRV